MINPDNKNKRILVVEDEQLLLDLYVEILREEGYRVDSASDGKEGYVAMRRGGYDLILLDVILPQIDGLEVLRMIKQGKPPDEPNKKVVLLTNLSKDKTIAQSIDLGVDDCLIKSDLNPGEFIEKVAKYLR